MKLSVKCFFPLCAILLVSSCLPAKKIQPEPLPIEYHGNFEDDYGIQYRISDSLFFQLPDAKYHILQWNKKEKYIIAKNDDHNPSERGLFSRIDITDFSGMEPFKFGFCLTAYKATNVEEAKNTSPADRNNPRTGCGGFPFSRLKRID